MGVDKGIFIMAPMGTGVVQIKKQGSEEGERSGRKGRMNSKWLMVTEGRGGIRNKLGGLVEGVGGKQQLQRGREKKRRKRGVLPKKVA